MDSQDRTVFIHIGWHKTGSTSIQSLMRENREVLNRDSGLYYPRTGQAGHAHHPLAQSILGSDPADTARWADLARELAETRGWRTALVSTEMLNHATDAQLEGIVAALTGDWKLRAICYLRQPDEFMEASFAERVKSGQFAGNWPDMLAEAAPFERPLYLQVVRRWRKFLGDDAVVLRPFERASWTGGDLYADFFETIGHPGAERLPGITIPPRANISPDAATLAVLRETIRRLGAAGTTAQSGHFLITQLCDPIGRHLARAGITRAPARFFTDEERADYRAKFAPVFAELGITFAFPDRYPEEPQLRALPEYDAMADAEREQTLMAAVVEMFGELAAIHTDEGAEKSAQRIERLRGKLAAEREKAQALQERAKTLNQKVKALEAKRSRSLGRKLKGLLHRPKG